MQGKKHESGKTYDLEPKRVMELVEPIQDAKVIDELYTFGLLLFNETKEMRARIESKALTVLTWSIAIAGFIYTQANGLAKNGSASWLFILATVAAMAAITSSYLAIRTKSRAIPSDEDWFEHDGFDNVDELKLYHVRSLHEVKHNLTKISAKKANRLFFAETCITISGTVLVLAVIFKIV